VAGDSVATATKALKQKMAAAGIHAENAQFLRVPKDADGLLALSFGRVDAALVTHLSVEYLKRVQPAAVTALRSIYETENILRAPLCVVAGRSSAADQQRVVAAIAGMDADANGHDVMGFLGVDKWTPFQPWMLQATH
jgi:ABC-type amino acid transport substrate-binding protein